jgi:Zn-dependent protease with chaperone function
MTTTMTSEGSAPCVTWEADGSTPSTAPREFPSLHASAFQHPLDRQAAAALQRVPLFSKLIGALAHVPERSMGLLLRASALQLKRDQGGAIYEKFVRAAAILDLPEVPEIYLSSNLQLNAIATGVERYRIVLYAPLVDLLTEDELLAIIGHELGHVKYPTMVM